MPYIASSLRPRVAPRLAWHAQNPGELNYQITELINVYLADFGVNYANLNAVIGVLECAKQELYRRVAAPYEDGKKEQNGDVYAA